MKLCIQAGATSQTVNVWIQDSSSTIGAALTGLAFNTASLTAYYALPKAAATAITLATLAAVTSAYSSGGFKEIDATNMPGWYRFDVPDAAIASGRFVSIHLKGASNMAPLPIEIELTGWNNQDAVRGGMTALPNANAEAAGGLYTRGTGAGQIAQQANGQADTNLSTIKTQAVTCAAGVTVLASVGTAAASTAQTGDNYARLGAPAGASLSADVAAVKVDTAAVKVQSDKLTFTVANQIDANVLDWKSSTAPAMTGDAFARLGAPAGASVSADVAAVKVDTAAVKVQTDKFAFTVTNQVDSNVLDWKSATAPAMTGDAFARLGAPAGASVSADVAAVKVDTAAVKVKTDSLTFTVSNQVDSNVIDWKGATAPAMTGDSFARLGAPAGASVSADIAAVKVDTAAVPTATANADALLKRDMSAVTGEAARSPLNAFRAIRNKVAISAGTMTVRKEDDSTSAWTASVTTDATAVPIVTIDPA